MPVLTGPESSVKSMRSSLLSAVSLSTPFPSSSFPFRVQAVGTKFHFSGLKQIFLCSLATRCHFYVKKAPFTVGKWPWGNKLWNDLRMWYKIVNLWVSSRIMWKSSFLHPPPPQGYMRSLLSSKIHVYFYTNHPEDPISDGLIRFPSYWGQTWKKEVQTKLWYPSSLED